MKPIGIDPDATLPPSNQEAKAPHSKIARHFGDYELLEEIARGGMGVVYKARQVSLNRIVGLKMILAGQLASENDVQRFRMEAESAANLDHPNILPIYEVGEHEGQHYFSMKYVDGGTLSDRLATLRSGDNERTPQLGVINLLISVSRAVHFAHQRGILHRDIKPGNVLIDRDGTPFVTDFGLAKKTEGDSGLTQTGAIVGTPSYMAPEQAASPKNISTSADVYALGAMLYEALTGRPPFRGTNAMETLLQVINDEPPTPRSLDANVDRDLETIALKCVAKEPSRRYASAGEFADDLERWQHGEPIQARATGTMEKAWRWAKRRPLIAALTAAVIVMLVGGTIGMSLLYARSEKHRIVAEGQRDVAQKQQSRAEAGERTAKHYLYSSNIKLAARAWEAGDVRQMIRILDQARPQTDEPDLRSFEWHYFRNLANAADSTRQLGDKVKSGRLIAAAEFAVTTHEGQNGLTIWDLRTGETKKVAGQFVLGCTSQPDTNGLWTLFTGEIAEATPDKADDPAARPKPFRKRQGQVIVRAFNPAEGVSREPDHTIDCQINHDMMPPRDRNAGPNAVVAFAPDVRMMAVLSGKSAFEDKQPDTVLGGLRMATSPPFQVVVRWHDLSNGQVKERPFSGMPLSERAGAPFGSPAISPDGQSLAVMGISGPPNAPMLMAASALPKLNTMQQVIFRTDRTRRHVDTWKGKSTFSYSGSLGFTPDGKGLLVGSHLNELRLLDSKTGIEKGSFRGHSGVINAAAYSPDGTTLATASHDQTVRLWDTKSFGQKAVLAGHLADVKDVCWKSDGKSLVSIDRDGQVKTWSIERPPGPRIIPVSARPSLTFVFGFLGFLSDGHTLLLDVSEMRANFGVQSKSLFDSMTGKPRTDISLPSGNVLCSAIDDTASRILLGPLGMRFNDESKVASWIEWNTKTNETRNVVPTRQGGFGMRATTHDGLHIAWIDYRDETSSVRLRGLTDGPDMVLASDKNAVVQRLMFTSDSQSLVALTKDGRVFRWNCKDGSEHPMRQLRFSPVGDAVLTPDNTKLIVSDADHRLHVIRLSDGQDNLTITGLLDQPRKLIATPDGKRVIVIYQNESRKNLIGMFGLAGGQEVLTLTAPTNEGFHLIALNPQGTRLAARTENAIYVWDATPHEAP